MKRTETHAVLPARPSEKPRHNPKARKIRLSLTKDLMPKESRLPRTSRTREGDILTPTTSLTMMSQSHGTDRQQRTDKSVTVRTKKQLCVRAYRKTKTFVLGLFKKNKDFVV